MKRLDNFKKKRTLNAGVIIAALYIFFLYNAQGQNNFINENLLRLSLYSLIIWSIIYTILNQKIFLNIYLKWYIFFTVICIGSLLYAVNQETGKETLYSLIVILGVTYALSVAVRTEKDLFLLFWMYSISATVTYVLLSLTDRLFEDERLGTTLYGNANIFSTLFMLAAIFSIWLFVYSKKSFKFPLFVMLITQLHALALSGGRKSFLIPILFLYLILLLKRDKLGRKHFIRYTFIFGVVAGILYWSIFNIPIIYNAIGYRIESLINMISGNGEVNKSDTLRSNMIDYGIDLWMNKPFLGNGLNNFSYIFGKNQGFYFYSHNNYVEILSGLGMLGFLFYYGFYVIVLKKLFSIKNDQTGLRNFGIAAIVCLLIFEYGAVTFNLSSVQIILLFSTFYLSFYKKKQSEIRRRKDFE